MENNEEKISYKLLILDFVLVILIVGVVFMLYSKSNVKKQVSLQNEVIQSGLFQNLNLEAKSAYVYDVSKNKILYQKNELAQLPLASITKLMTALTASELASKNSQITIKKEFLQEEGDNGLRDGEIWNLEKLIDFSLIVSSNDGARALASVIGAKNLQTTDYNIGREEFIKKMNEKAQMLGLNQTYFLNETGLDESLAENGGYASAQDVAKMVEYILKNKPEILEITKEVSTEISSLSLKHNAQNTNIDVGKIPNLIGSKTGYTDLAGGNLVIVFDSSIGNPVIIVVLGSTQEGRFTDILSLVNATMKYQRN